ncbi:MAG: DUF4124 domain-containing protein [Psychromonas sp.]
MKLFLLCFSSLFCFVVSTSSLAAQTKIYHWVDEDGKTHFSDTALPGTEQIEVHNDNILNSDIQTTTKSVKSDNLSSQVTDEPVIEYQATIISPEDDTALRSNNGTINIHVTTEPVKKNTHKLQLFLDGQALGSPQISPTISAQNIDRGTHQVQVQLLDENGNILALTQIVTVHLQRANKGL